MSADEQKALLRRYVEEVWDKGNLAALDDFLAADYRRHVSPTAAPLTRDGQKQCLAGFRSGFPDIELTLQDVPAEGDRVVFRSTMRGTHEGEFQGIPPTGKSVAVPGVVFYRIADGKIAEFRGQFDRMSLIQQLGVIPGAGCPTS